MNLEISPLLDDAADAFSSGNFDKKTVWELSSALTSIRNSQHQDEWSDITRAIREHRIHKILMQDPYTARAFEKPRGYAGDAVMIDFLYGREPYFSSSLGEKLFRATTSCMCAKAVVGRRRFIAEKITRMKSTKSCAIMSIGAGHLRERELILDLDGVEYWVAVDQDDKSLSEIQRSYGGDPAIQTFRSGVRHLISERTKFDRNFDLIYALGLFDYLSQPVAVALLRQLMTNMSVGGELLIANFHERSQDIGYMEAAMDWSLIYRTRESFDEIGQVIQLKDAAHEIFETDDGHLVWLHIRKDG